MTSMVPNAWIMWVNQKIGNFFGDFKEDRELQEEPGVCRGVTRLVCLLCLVGAFAYAFYRLYMDAPNVEVKRVYLQGKINTYYATDRLYSRSASYGTDIDAANTTLVSDQDTSAEHEMLDCPCTGTTISWTNFVHFYILNLTAPDGPPIMDYGPHNISEGFQLASGPRSFNGVVALGGDYYYLKNSSTVHNREDPSKVNTTYRLSRDAEYMTIEKFCANILLWPEDFMTFGIRTLDCQAMVGGLLTTKPQFDRNSEIGITNWNDPRASYFESPSLQSQKFLYSNTVHRLRAHLQDQYALLNVMEKGDDANSTKYRKYFLTGMAELWLYALDMFGANSSTSNFTFFMNAANTSEERFYERPKSFAVVLYEGQSFLGIDVDWNQYYNECRPTYCDVTRKSTTFHRTYTVLAVVGGLWGLAVVVVTLLLWPLIAFLLLRFSMCRSQKAMDTESADEMLGVVGTRNFK